MLGNIREERKAAAEATKREVEEQAVIAAKEKFEALRAGWYAEPVA